MKTPGCHVYRDLRSLGLTLGRNLGSAIYLTVSELRRFQPWLQPVYKSRVADLVRMYATGENELERRLARLYDDL